MAEHLPVPECECVACANQRANGARWKQGAHSQIRRVTCGSCGGTFAAYVYPPTKCELCDVSFRPADKVETREGDTLGKVLERAERKQLRKGKRK